MKKTFVALTLVAVLAAAPALAAPAAADKVLGDFGGWRAYMHKEGGQTVCYMVTGKTTKAAKVKRTTPYLMVTHRPVEASKDVFSYGAGLPLDNTRGVKLKIGAAAFELFSARDIAWARDAQTDHAIAAALKGGKEAQLSAVADQKGLAPVNDVFDIVGAGDAYRAISVACGLAEAAPKAAAKEPVKKEPAKKDATKKEPVKKEPVKSDAKKPEPKKGEVKQPAAGKKATVAQPAKPTKPVQPEKPMKPAAKQETEKEKPAESLDDVFRRLNAGAK